MRTRHDNNNKCTTIIKPMYFMYRIRCAYRNVYRHKDIRQKVRENRMYKGKFASELSINEVKEYYDELRQKYPHTDEQRADFRILQEKLIAFAYNILDGNALQAESEPQERSGEE